VVLSSIKVSLFSFESKNYKWTAMVRKEIFFFREPYRKATKCHPKTLNFPVSLKTSHKIKLTDYTMAV